MDGLASIKKNSSCPNDEILETILNLQQDDELTLQVRSHLGTCTRCQQRLDQLTSAPILKNMQLHEAGELEDSHRKLVSNIACLLYTSPSPRDQRGSRMPSSA